jgi:hypothetical protein
MNNKLEPDYDINKPKTYKDMLIFENTSFQPLFEIPYLCDRSITSLCKENKTKQECIDECQVDNNCKAGYYIINKNTNKSLCNPIRTSVYRDYNFSQDLYDAKNLYPDYEITSFIQKDLNFPPNTVTHVYYRDSLQLKNIETSTYLATKASSSIIEFNKVSTVIINCVSFDTFFNKITNKKLRYGDVISFVETDTSYILSFDSLQNIYWKSRLSPKISVNQQFIILNDDKSIGDEVERGDVFYLKTNLDFLVVLDKGVLRLDSRNKEELKINGIGYLFSFENKEPLYICESSNCRQLKNDEISKMIKMNDYFYYENNLIFKDPRCSGYCKIEDGGVKEKYTPIKSNIKVYISIFLILIIYFLIFYKVRR